MIEKKDCIETMVKCIVFLSLLTSVLVSYVEMKHKNSTIEADSSNRCNSYDRSRSKCCLEPQPVNISETKFAKELKSAGADIVYPMVMDIGFCRGGCNIRKSKIMIKALGLLSLDNGVYCCAPIEYKDFNVLILQEDMDGNPYVERKTIKGVMVSKCGYA